MKLSDAAIRRAAARERDYKVSDGGGLYLLVRPTGSRLWRWKYRYGGKEKKLSLGVYPETSLAAARRAAQQARELLAAGQDPSIERKRAARQQRIDAAATFEALAREWHAMQVPRWAKRHGQNVIRSFERDVFPTIGAFPVAAITAPDILDLCRTIEQRGAIETAHRIRQHISAVFVHAIASGCAEADPAAIIARALAPTPRKTRQPAILTLDGLRQLLRDTENSGAQPGTLLASRLLALTAVRSATLRGAQWAEFEGIDWDSSTAAPDAVWHIPAARMKLSQERKGDQRLAFTVPLAHQAVDVLRAAHLLSGQFANVFPNVRYAHRPMSENAIGYLYNRAGYQSRHVPHGWRAAFSTIMNERAEREWQATGGAGVAPDRAIIDLMLGHVPPNAVEAAYNRAAYMPRRRELAQEWADLLLAGLQSAENLLYHQDFNRH